MVHPFSANDDVERLFHSNSLHNDRHSHKHISLVLSNASAIFYALSELRHNQNNIFFVARTTTIKHPPNEKGGKFLGERHFLVLLQGCR